MTQKNKTQTELSLKCGCGCNKYFEIMQWDDDELYLVMINAYGKESLLTRSIAAFNHILGKDLIQHELIFKQKQITQLKKFIINL